MESFKEQRKPHMVRAKSSSLPALAFSSASLTSSRESERAEQHRAAQTLHKQKTQPQSASWTAPSTGFPQMAKGDLLSPIRSSLLSLAPPCRQSLDWAQAAISPWDLSRQWEKTGGFVQPTRTVTVLVTRCRDKKILSTHQRRAQMALWVEGYIS